MRGELRELAVGLDEAVEGFGAALDDSQATVEVGERAVHGLAMVLGETRAEASGDGLDRARASW